MKGTMKRSLISAFLLAAVFLAGLAAGQQKNRGGAGHPKTIIHFVTLKWKAGTPEAERQKAIEGISKMADRIPGIKNVWVKTLRVQPQDYNVVFALEFRNQDAADEYREHPAHAAWEQSYLGLRENSFSGQATN